MMSLAVIAKMQIAVSFTTLFNVDVSNPNYDSIQEQKAKHQKVARHANVSLPHLGPWKEKIHALLASKPFVLETPLDFV